MSAQPRTSVNLTGFIVGVTLVVVLTKLSSYLSPYQAYFSFSNLFLEDLSNRHILGLTIKLMIPTLVGFILFTLPFFWLVRTATTMAHVFQYYRYILRQSTSTAISSCVFASLLQSWPFIQYWDILMRPDYGNLRIPFLLVYGLYMVAYGYFALLGVYLGKVVYRKRLPDAEVDQAAAAVGWLDTIRVVLIGSVTTALATFYSSYIQLPVN